MQTQTSAYNGKYIALGFEILTLEQVKAEAEFNLENPRIANTRFTKDERRKARQQWLPDQCYNCELQTCIRHKNGKFQECRIHIQHDLYQARHNTYYDKKHASYCQYCTEWLIERKADNAIDPCHECQIGYHNESTTPHSLLGREINQMELI